MGTRAWPPAGTFTSWLLWKVPSFHDVAQVTSRRVLLMRMICFSTVSPWRKLWSLLVKRPALPPMKASKGWLFRSSASPSAVATQSERSNATSMRSCRSPR